MKKTFWFLFFALLASACSNTRELTYDESERISEQLRAHTMKYAECYRKFGGKKAGVVEIVYLLEFGGKWAKVAVDEGKSDDYSAELKDCLTDTIFGIELGIRPRTKVHGTYTIKFAGG